MMQHASSAGPHHLHSSAGGMPSSGDQSHTQNQNTSIPGVSNAMLSSAAMPHWNIMAHAGQTPSMLFTPSGPVLTVTQFPPGVLRNPVYPGIPESFTTNMGHHRATGSDANFAPQLMQQGDLGAYDPFILAANYGLSAAQGTPMMNCDPNMIASYSAAKAQASHIMYSQQYVQMQQQVSMHGMKRPTQASSMHMNMDLGGPLDIMDASGMYCALPSSDLSQFAAFGPVMGVRICMYICIYIQIHTYVCMCICMYVCMYINTENV